MISAWPTNGNDAVSDHFAGTAAPWPHGKSEPGHPTNVCSADGPDQRIALQAPSR